MDGFSAFLASGQVIFGPGSAPARFHPVPPFPVRVSHHAGPARPPQAATPCADQPANLPTFPAPAVGPSPPLLRAHPASHPRSPRLTPALSRPALCPRPPHQASSHASRQPAPAYSPSRARAVPPAPALRAVDYVGNGTSAAIRVWGNGTSASIEHVLNGAIEHVPASSMAPPSTLPAAPRAAPLHLQRRPFRLPPARACSPRACSACSARCACSPRACSACSARCACYARACSARATRRRPAWMSPAQAY